MIDYGNGVKIYGTGDKAYESDVKKLLDDRIKHNMVVNVIFNAIGAASTKDKNKTKYLTIVPFNVKDRNGKLECNAGTDPDDEEAAGPAGGLNFNGLDDADTPVDERYKVLGTTKGGGSGSSVKFTPSMFVNAANCASGLFGGQADEIVFHEMIHGLRDLQGLRFKIPTIGNVQTYENQEEFLAIVITNIYMSVKGTTKLRGSFDARFPWLTV
ncbi:MAG: hypothetical protein ACJ8FY_00720 [Gemmataceae bacterium]